MPKVRNAIIATIKDYKVKTLKQIRNAQKIVNHEGNSVELYNGEDYTRLMVYLTEKQASKSLKEQKAILTQKETKKIEKFERETLEKLDQIERSQMPTYIEIVSVYKRSATWGHCPHCELSTSNGYYQSRSITGCGYDKESTASAEALDHENGILKAILERIGKLPVAKIKELLKSHDIRELLGYGLSISHLLPSFDGGVGMRSHLTILENLGYKLVSEYYGNSENYYRLELKKGGKR